MPWSLLTSSTSSFATSLPLCFSHPFPPTSVPLPPTPHPRWKHTLGSSSWELLTAPLNSRALLYFCILVHEVLSAWYAITSSRSIYPLKPPPGNLEEVSLGSAPAVLLLPSNRAHLTLGWTGYLISMSSLKGLQLFHCCVPAVPGKGKVDMYLMNEWKRLRGQDLRCPLNSTNIPWIHRLLNWEKHKSNQVPVQYTLEGTGNGFHMGSSLSCPENSQQLNHSSEVC